MGLVRLTDLLFVAVLRLTPTRARPPAEEGRFRPADLVAVLFVAFLVVVFLAGERAPDDVLPDLFPVLLRAAAFFAAALFAAVFFAGALLAAVFFDVFFTAFLPAAFLRTVFRRAGWLRFTALDLRGA